MVQVQSIGINSTIVAYFLKIWLTDYIVLVLLS